MDEFDLLTSIINSDQVENDLSNWFKPIHQELLIFFGKNLGTAIALYNPEISQIEVPFCASGLRLINQKPINLGNNLISKIFQNGQLHLIDPVINDENPGLKFQQRTASSWLGVPISIADKTIGVLILQNFQVPNGLSVKHIALIKSITRLITDWLQ